MTGRVLWQAWWVRSWNHRTFAAPVTGRYRSSPIATPRVRPTPSRSSVFPPRVSGCLADVCPPAQSATRTGYWAWPHRHDASATNGPPIGAGSRYCATAPGLARWRPRHTGRATSATPAPARDCPVARWFFYARFLKDWRFCGDPAPIFSIWVKRS